MPRMVLWCLPLLWLAVIFAGFLIYGASGHDDAHINFWLAHTLLEHGELLNYNGERIDQGTNLLQVFVMALFAKLLPFGLVTCGYLTDIAACLACCGLLTWLTRKICPALFFWPALVALSSVSFMVWVFGGMGGVLAALCLLAGVTAWWQFIELPILKPVHYTMLIVVALALVFVRPEMPLVIPVISLYVLVFYWRDAVKSKRCLQVLLLNFLASLLLLCWQKFYFSSWLPLPVMAKQSGNTLARLPFGTIYVVLHSVLNPVIGISLLFTVPVSVMLLWKSFSGKMADIKTSARNGLWVVLTGPLLVYTGFIVTAGGDWMQAGRFLVPLIPLAALFVTSVLLALVRKPLIAHLLLATLVAGAFRLHPFFFIDGATGVPVWVRYRMMPEHASYSLFEQYNYEHLRDMALVDHLREIIPPLHEKLGRPVRLLSGQAGMVFYKMAEEFPNMVQFTDLHGLVEGSLTLCPLLTAETRHDMYGLVWQGYKEYFSMLPLLQEKCGIQPPDLLFDLNGLYHDQPQIFADAGYTLVHKEQGILAQNDTALPAGRNDALLNFMFIRSDLLPLLQDSGERTIDYSLMPLHERWGFSILSPALHLPAP